MNVQNFLSLAYREQIKLLNETGRLKKTIVLNNYHYSLYEVGRFYVELKRGVRELNFEGIRAFDDHELPSYYKES